MARRQLAGLPWGVVQDRHGNAIVAYTVEINHLDGSDAAVYAAATGLTQTTPITDAEGYVAGWVESGWYSVVLPDRTLTVFTEDDGGLGLFNVHDYAEPEDSSDAQAFQRAVTAAEAAGRGTVFLPAGVYTHDEPCPIDPLKPIDVIGEGQGVSIIEWSEDAGTGEYALFGSHEGVDGNTKVPHRVANLTLRGTLPETFDGPPVTPRDMDGIGTLPYMVLDNVGVEGFHANVVIRFHHEQIIGASQIRNGYYNIYWSNDSPEGIVLRGDHLIGDGVDLAGTYFACMAWDPSVYTSLHVGRVHTGFGPYVFYRETKRDDATDSALWLTRLICKTTEFESFGNGIIYDESFFSYIADAEFINCGDYDFDNARWAQLEDGTRYYSIPDRDQDYSFVVKQLSGVRITGESFPTMVGREGVFRVDTCFSFQWDDARRALAYCGAFTGETVGARTDVEGSPIVLDGEQPFADAGVMQTMGATQAALYPPFDDLVAGGQAIHVENGFFPDDGTTMFNAAYDAASTIADGATVTRAQRKLFDLGSSDLSPGAGVGGGIANDVEWRLKRCEGTVTRGDALVWYPTDSVSRASSNPPFLSAAAGVALANGSDGDYIPVAVPTRPGVVQVNVDPEEDFSSADAAWVSPDGDTGIATVREDRGYVIGYIIDTTFQADGWASLILGTSPPPVLS